MDKKDIKKALKNEVSPLLKGIRNDLQELFVNLKKDAEENELDVKIFRGKPGEDGKTPVKDVDYPSHKTVTAQIKKMMPKKASELFTKEDIKKIAIMASKLIQKPKDGKPGKDATAERVDYGIIKELIDQRLKMIENLHEEVVKFVVGSIESKIQGLMLTPTKIRDMLEKLQGSERLDAKAIKGLEKYIKTVIVSGGGGGGNSGGGSGGSVSWGDINGDPGDSSSLVDFISEYVADNQYWTRDISGGFISPTTITDKVAIGGTNPTNIFEIGTYYNLGYLKFNHSYLGPGTNSGSALLDIGVGSSSGSTAGAYMAFTGKLEAWVSVIATSNASGYRVMRFGNSTNGVVDTTNGTFAIQRLNDASNAILATAVQISNGAPTGAFTMLASGYLGLGTIAPNAPLHVKGNTTNLDFIRVQSSATNQYSSIGFFNSSNTQMASYGYGGSAVGGNYQDKLFFNSENKDIVWGFSSNIRMTLKYSNGFLGVGSPVTPTNPLTVVASNPSAGIVKIQNTASGNSYASVDFFDYLNSQTGGFGYGNSGSVYPDQIYFYSINKDLAFGRTAGGTDMRMDGFSGQVYFYNGINSTRVRNVFGSDVISVEDGSGPLVGTTTGEWYWGYGNGWLSSTGDVYANVLFPYDSSLSNRGFIALSNGDYNMVNGYGNWAGINMMNANIYGDLRMLESTGNDSSGLSILSGGTATIYTSRYNGVYSRVLITGRGGSMGGTLSINESLSSPGSYFVVESSNILDDQAFSWFMMQGF